MRSCARQLACGAPCSLWYRCLKHPLRDAARMRHNVVIFGAVVSDLVPARIRIHRAPYEIGCDGR